MQKVWLVPYCALGMVFYAGTAHAAFWQVIRDTPVRVDAAADARVLDTARKGWIVNDMVQSASRPQWIRVVELQQQIGDGMAYAHLLYRVPDAYISATDVVQVADENGTPLRKAEAATAHGVRVERMLAPQTTDMACNGAVDAAALQAALNAWVQACNAVLDSLEGMEPEKAAMKMLAWDDEPPFVRTGIEAVESSAAELLNRWMGATYGAPATLLNADDQKVLALLVSYGLLPQMAEGTAFLTVDVNALRKRVSFEPPVAAYTAYTAYMALLESQPSVLFADGGCRYSVKEMGSWAVQWDRYLKTVPANSLYFREGRKRYLNFMTHILLSDLPNTSAFPRHNKGRMEKAWMAALQSVASENPGTRTAALITEFLGKIKASGNRLSPAYEKALLDRMLSPTFPGTK